MIPPRPLGAPALLLAFLMASSTSGGDAGWRQAGLDHAWSFPADHWAHREYRVEWWYLTGHLETVDPPTRRFGYQFTLFRIGLTPDPPGLDSAWSAAGLLMGHASLTDLDGGGHRFSEVLYRETPLLAGFESPPGPRIAWSRGPAGTDRAWTLDWNGAGFDLAMADRARGWALELDTRPLKPRVFQGPSGLSRKADEPGAASLYSSFTRLDTAGDLEIDGQRLRVRGTSWMDQEISSSQLGSRQVGWDWFSLQLDDGRDLMLYSLRDAEGEADFASATLVDREGRPTYLGAEEFSVRVTGRWTSPQTGTTYPSGWTLELPGHGLELTVEPLVDAQENVARLARGLRYWEGAVRVLDPGGAPFGRGYVELTGYGEGNRPPV